jgi:hypothetical protein
MRRIHASIIVGAALAVFAASTPGNATERVKKIYVALDYTAMHHDQTAFIWYVHDTLGWTRGEGSSTQDSTCTIRWDELFSTHIGGTDTVQFLGVSDIQVLEGDVEIGDTTYFSTDWEYAEMIHHFVARVNTSHQGIDPCQNRIWPIGAGSEQSHYVLPAGPNGKQYAMRFLGSETIEGAAWHWANPGEISGEDVWLELSIKIDDDQVQSHFTDVNCTWISYEYCEYSFCQPSGEQTILGPTRPVAQDGRIVLAMPHVHDHVDEMRLKYSTGLTDYYLFTTSPPSNPQWTVAHDPECTEVAAHAHAGHLPVGGLINEVETPGVNGPVVEAGANHTLNVEMDFDVPHGTTESIDAMGIYLIFWEPL